MGTDFTMSRGDTVTFAAVVTLGGLPFPLTGCTLWFTGKTSYASPDGSAVFQKTIGSGITITNAALGYATLVISSIDTDSLGNSKTLLVWDLQIKDSDGNIFTAASGNIIVYPDVTRSTT